jgi:hypothetical protein
MKPPLRTKSVGTKVSEEEFALLEWRRSGDMIPISSLSSPAWRVSRGSLWRAVRIMYAARDPARSNLFQRRRSGDRVRAVWRGLQLRRSTPTARGRNTFMPAGSASSERMSNDHRIHSQATHPSLGGGWAIRQHPDTPCAQAALAVGLHQLGEDVTAGTRALRGQRGQGLVDHVE